MEYNLELEKAIQEIKRTNAKTVCIQLPDGLKPKAVEITNHLRKNTEAEIFIWADTCFGACDIPEIKEIDLIIQWGHSDFSFKQ